MGLKTMKSSKTPQNITIKPNRMDFEFGDHIPKYWCYNDPFMTHFVGALSTFFPDGERFFIDSVRHYREVVKDDKVRQQEIAGLLVKKPITPKNMKHSI